MFYIPTPIILLVGLTAATCVIAYWSDNLGKKLGKKRISLQLGKFSLRPRQTATLITMLSSVGIMLVTLATLTLFSDQVRNALFRSERLNESNKKYRRENALLAAQSARLKASVASSDTQAQEADARAAAAVAKADATTRSANARVAAAGAKIVGAARQLRDARGQLGAAQAARAAAQRGEQTARRGQQAAYQSERVARRDEKTARARAQQIVQKLSQAQVRLTLAQSRLGAAQGRLRAVNGRLASAQSGLRRAQNSIEQVKRGNRGILQSNRTLLAQLEKGRASVEALKGEQGKLETEVSEAQNDLDRARKAAAGLYVIAAQLGFGRVVVEVGQVFAEIVVPRRAREAELRDALSRLLNEGAAAATKLGAKPYPDPNSGALRALHLEPLSAEILGGEAQGDALLSEDQIIDHFVNYLSTFDVPVSIRLAASRRYAEGEDRFEARLVSVPVKRAFARGETLAEATIDGSQSDARVFNQLLALVDKGGAQAREKGMVPLLSEQNPDFFAAGTNERIFEFLRVLQERSGRTRVRLIAAEDLLTIDNPSVRFQIAGDA